MQRRPATVLVFFAALALAAPAQAEQVIPVPMNPMDLSVGHPVHEGARVTLKAVVRDMNCHAYWIAWDTDLDGDFRDEARVSRSKAHAARSVGRSFIVPEVPRSMPLRIPVEVWDPCEREFHFATDHLDVHDWPPPEDARLWTEEQLRVMSAIALDEALWYVHLRMRRLPDGEGADIRGRTLRADVGMLYVWLLALNGHQPAWPPDSVQGSSEHPSLTAGKPPTPSAGRAIPTPRTPRGSSTIC